jgi:ubiquinone/menaquinone biosynthesis C-methylase UbiE
MTAINSREYWNNRFHTNDWRKRGGNRQSRIQAWHFVETIRLEDGFAGSIADVGCAEGDAMEVYSTKWPNARLFGYDFSESAIQNARQRLSDIARFEVAEFEAVPFHDIIICSHVLEHLQDHDKVIETLARKCQKLFVVVPFEENPIDVEHLRVYGKGSYSHLKPISEVVCDSAWHLPMHHRLFRVYILNAVRFALGRPIWRKHKQIVYEFLGTAGIDDEK